MNLKWNKEFCHFSSSEEKVSSERKCVYIFLMGKKEEETNIKSVHMHVILSDVKEEELSQYVNILMWNRPS